MYSYLKVTINCLYSITRTVTLRSLLTAYTVLHVQLLKVTINRLYSITCTVTLRSLLIAYTVLHVQLP